MPRIRNVTENGFEIRLKETAPCLNDTHCDEQASYLVIEAGRYVLPDGTQIEADYRTISEHPPGSNAVFYEMTFLAPPVVLASITTCSNPEFVKPRLLTEPSTTGFEIALEPADTSANCACYVHSGEETIDWIAVSTGAGINNGTVYACDTTGNQVNQD